MTELKSGDLCIPGSETYGDYRDQLVPWEPYRRQIATYAEQAGLPAPPLAIVTGLRARPGCPPPPWPLAPGRGGRGAGGGGAADPPSPANEHVEIVGKKPVLRRLR